MRLAAWLKGLLPCAALLAPWHVVALDPDRSVAQYQHTRWTLEDGSPQNIRALAQTPDGYLWIGADTGLYRFDGITFEPMPMGADAVLQGPVFALYVSRSGDLYVGYLTGRILRVRNGRPTDITPSQLKGPVFQFAEARDGSIWIVTGDFGFQLGRYANRRWTNVDTSWGRPAGANPTMLAMGRDGTVWLYAIDHLLFLRQGARRFADIPARNTFNPALAADAGGGIWMSDSLAGTWRVPDYPAGRRDRGRLIAPFAAEQGARKILFDRDGNLWGTTQTHGIFRIASPNSVTASEEVYSAENGLSSNLADPILEDREGNIWVGTTLGLDRFRAANVVVENGITQRSRWGYVLFADSRGNIYAVDSDTAYRVRPGGKPEALRRGLFNPQSICEASDGAVWVSANGAMLAIRDSGIADAPPPPPGLNYLDCVQTRDGSLWFSLVGDGFLRFGPEGWRHFTLAEAKIQPNIILADRRGGLLASERTGPLKRLDLPRVRSLWKYEDMPGGGVRVLYQGAGDTLIGSAVGLARLRGDRIERLRVNYSWLEGVAGLVETPEGETWVLATQGIARVASRDLDAAFADPTHALAPQFFDRLDGLPPTAPFYSKNAAARGGDGRLWFVTSEAIVWIDPASLARNTVPPPVTIKALTAGGVRHRDPKALTLARGTSRLQIDYTALSLSIPERVHFRYRLEGADDGWVDPGTRRQAFYTNLGPGTYRFHVIAANNDGVWNRQGATLEFTIPPTFVQSNWFLVLVLLGLGVLLWLAYSLRVRQITARVRSGLEVRLAERERIARELHDTLLQSFQGLVLRFQAIAERIPADQPLRPIVDQALERADAALVEGRDRVRELRTAGGDLSQAFVAVAEELAAESAARFNLTVEGHARELHPMVRDEVEHIGAEAIRNAFQHARADEIEAVLTYASNELRFDLRDDGIGLPSAFASGGTPDGHYGLTGMRERASRVGGTLTISSRKQAGTEVGLSIPARAAYAAQGRRWKLPSFLANWRKG